MITFPALPEAQPVDTYLEIKNVVNQIMRGKINSVGEFEIAPSTIETTVPNFNVSANSFISFLGLNSDSTIGEIYLKNISIRSFTIGHNSGTFLRKYRYVVFG